MTSNNKTSPIQLKQKQLSTYLHKSINKNPASILDSNISTKSSTMSSLAADLRTATATVAAANTKSDAESSMGGVVVNSIIYSKPSFCGIVVDLGESEIRNSESTTTTKLTNGINQSKIFNNETFCPASMSLQQTAMNFDASFTSLHPSITVDNDAQVYRICTTINGSIHHQISDFCDNILAMAEFFGVANDEHDDDSLIEFAYDDDDEYEDGSDYMDDDGSDVVDFSYEGLIDPAPKINYDKKKKVRFNTKPTVHVMHTWDYAYRAARKGEWEMYARDRERFKLRIQRAALIINPILDKEHHQKIYERRFADLYDKDNDQQQNRSFDKSVICEDAKETATSNITSKTTHHKKKRKKKRFCRMGNKHYF